MMLLSIITICKNEKARIRQTIDSVLSQSFKSFEYIVIDGASTDGTMEIIQEYESEIDIIISELDTGIYNAMNKGLKYAKGEYIYFLNGGDYLYNNSVLFEVFSYNFNTDIIYGYLLSTFNGEQRYVKAEETITKKYLLDRTLPHCATITKKQFFSLTNGFDESYKIAGDYDFFLKAILKYKASTQYIPVLFAYFNPNGIARNNPEIRTLEKRRAQKNNFNPFYLFAMKYIHDFSFKTKNKIKPLIKRWIKLFLCIK